MNNLLRTSLSFLFLFTVGTADSEREIDGVLVVDPGLEASSIGFSGTWTLGSGSSVSVGENSQKQIEISIDGEPTKRLVDGLYVESGSMDRERVVLVLLVNRLEKSVGGVFYSHLIVVRDDLTGSEGPALGEFFQRSDLVRYDGRQRDLISLGCVDDFPLIDLFMAYNETNERPTATLYGWQRWNVLNNSFIGALSSELAESRKRGEN